MRYPSDVPLEFLAIGHVTIDKLEGRQRIGGAAAYAAATARHLGLASGIVTSAAADFPFWELLAGIETHSVRAEASTTFDNAYAERARRQRVEALAAPIRARHIVVPRLADTAAVLYCPVVHEIEAPLIPLAPPGPCGVAPQGFFRQWDASGEVTTREWNEASHALARADFVCMSEEDAPGLEAIAKRFTGRAAVITRAENGCRVYGGTELREIPAAQVEAIDPTGAGDVFAATFLVALRGGSNLVDAAELATKLAAQSIRVEGVPWLTP